MVNKHNVEKCREVFSILFNKESQRSKKIFDEYFPQNNHE
jgi:hypothetical protein